MDTNQNINLVLLQIWLTSVGVGLQSPAAILFSRPIQGFLHQINRGPISVDNDDAQYEALKAGQNKYKDNDTQKILSLLQGLQ